MRAKWRSYRFAKTRCYYESFFGEFGPILCGGFKVDEISLIKITFQFENVTFIELRWRMTRGDGKRYRGAGKTTMTVERFRSPPRYETT